MASEKLFTLAPLPSTTRGEGIKLSADPKGKTFLYANGKSVFLRDLKNPSLATEYVGHKANTVVARYSPSGYYIASGDVAGNVRIWDAINDDHILKSEVQPLSGKINDVAWDADSKRIIAVGDGKERFGHAFMFDTLSSVGEITGHSKVVNSVSIRQQRPFRAVTASDDMSVTFFNGVPFKYNTTIRDHTRFVYSVQFSPNGEFFVSAGADGKIFLYDGATGDKKGSFGDAHDGSVFSVAWSGDSTQLVSSSGDRTAKIWDIATQKAVTTFHLGDDVNDQQVGNLWQDDWLISTSLSGQFNYLDKATGKAARRVDGHSKAITAVAVDAKNKTLTTGSYDGRVYSWTSDDDGWTAKAVQGSGHTNQVKQIIVDDASSDVFSIAMDDTLRHIDQPTHTFDKVISTDAQPQGMAVAKDKVYVTAEAALHSYDKPALSKNAPVALKYDASVVDVARHSQDVYVASQQVRVYDSSHWSVKKELPAHMGKITALAAHPTEPLLAVGDSLGKIFVYDVNEGKTVLQHWVFHSARITGLQWSEDGDFLVSGGLDTQIYVWNRHKPMRKSVVKNAHVDAVNGVGFLKSDKASESLQVVSVGQDAAVRIFDIKKPQ
ncbi:WD40 repeat-like protein [Hesseltinella vesiculosa]|uniref:WD40 repeat-like protein n=1 Tax=Hesseltinella vesiculosa TaxID=101127 RepID=A0A1X2G889_9FUNG|nr:WD40 repeat-like protein [Hesseltinella vesiculosa]